MIWIASVSTLLFNLNPLVRFDGYYMLSDFLDIPNLQTRAQDYLVFLVEFYLFGNQRAINPAQESGGEAPLLFLYAVLSAVYRTMVSAFIVFFVAGKFLLLGVLMALFCIVSWVVMPVFRLVAYLATSARLARVRLRATL